MPKLEAYRNYDELLWSSDLSRANEAEKEKNKDDPEN
jgi:hypothetical protein